MKRIIAFLLVAVMVCACVPALAMFDNLGWEAADPDHRALTDEILEKLNGAMKNFKDGAYEPVMVLSTQHATSDEASTDMDDASKSTLQNSLNDLLKHMGIEGGNISTTYVHGDDVCVLCRVTPNDSKLEPYWIMVFVSYEGELLEIRKLDTDHRAK